MKTSYKIFLPAIVLLIISLAMGCSKSSDGSDADIYIPDINNNWINSQDANNQFSFFDAPTNAATGTFSGNEEENGTGIGSITGSFNHSQIMFNVTYSDNVTPTATYSGTVSGTTTKKMVLTSSGKTLTLIKTTTN